MTLRFPREIVLYILDHFPQEDVLYFHKRVPETDPLHPLLVKRLHTRVMIYPFDFPEFLMVKEEDTLRNIVELNIPIKYLDIRKCDNEWFLKIVLQNPDYFSKIPSLALRGNTEDFRRFYHRCLIKNLIELELYGLLTSSVLQLPPHLTPKLKKISSTKCENFRKWPANLKCLELYGCDVSLIVLPDTLQELLCSDNEWKNGRLKFPRHLKKLQLLNESISIEKLDFPEELEDLTIVCHDAVAVGERLRFPSTVKKLELNFSSITSQESVEFPGALETLCVTLGDQWPYPKANFRFPSNLKELTLSRCKLDGSDIDMLPSSLQNLDITCDTLEGRSLPRGLKHLGISTLDCIKNFPPNLESLFYVFQTEKQQHLYFNFPSTLRKLELACYEFCTFDLNLPPLESMELDKCCGAAPPTVRTLKLVYGGDKYRNFIVPIGVTELEVCCPLKNYPDSIITLSIGEFEPRMTAPLPTNLRYLNLTGTKDLYLKDIRIPPSVDKLSGSFPFWEIERFKSKAGEEENFVRKDKKNKCEIC